jgi:serine/threonine protein kinase
LLHPQDVIRISNALFTYEVADTASSKLSVSPNPAEVRTTSEQGGLLSAFNEANTGEHVGKQLGNHRLVRLIGQGAFAEVYLAEHIHLDTQAAIKVLYTKLAKDDIETFRQEARTIARLVHPHIVRVLDFGVEGTTPFLVMDYAPGDTLRQLYPKGTRLPLETVVSYVKQVADALSYAHAQKVIHRDVKPENMLMGRHGEVLLSDFGIALITQSSRYENVMDIAGTIAYMAPEQIEAHPLPASDQYSLGVVTYEWLTGDRPFQGSFREIAIKHSFVSPPSLIEQVPTLPLAIEQVVLIALAKDPKQRFGSVLAFATALEQASKVKQLEPEPVFQVSETTDANQSSQPEMASPSVPFSMQEIEGEVSADIPPQTNTTAPLSGKELLGQVEEERSRQTEEESISQAEEERRRQVEETTVPPIVAPESTPAPATFVPEATPAPSVSEPLSATEAASSPSTSPDVPSISSSDSSAVPSLRDIWRSHKPVVIGVLLVLVLLFGIIGGVIYASKTINRATATDAINSSIAQANARNIAQLDPALVASTPDPYPPTNGKLTLYDPMHDNSNQGFGWDEGNGCHFTGTAYQVNSTCTANNLQLNNFAFEIEVDFTQTSSQYADVFFRNLNSPDTWYAFTIYNNGTYDFESSATTLLGGRVTPILLTAIRSDAIHQGALTNTIAIVANGSTIDLYANGVKLNSFNDSSSNYGGMFLASGNPPVNFRNAKLWTF